MTDPGQARTDARRAALDLLSRREHSRRELERKLAHRGFEGDVVDEVLAWLSERDYLCERRFSESFVRSRASKGFAPERLVQELASRGVEEELARQVVTEAGPGDPLAVAVELAWARAAAGREAPQIYRFLRRRGFTHEVALRAISETHGDVEG